jgi:hypothetical protein
VIIAFSQWVGVVLAFHLDIPAQRYRTESPLRTATPFAGDNFAKPDTEPLDGDTESTGGYVVTQFMEKNQN